MPAPTPIPPTLRKRPFTLAEARAAGLTGRVLRGCRFRRVFRGVYASADLPDTPLLRLDAATLLAPHAFATDRTAAGVMGLPVPDDAMTYLGIRRGEPRPKATGIRVREYAAPPPTTTIDGRVVADPASAFIQLAERLSLRDVVVAGDAMVRAGLIPIGTLRQAAARAIGQVGIRARRATSLVRVGVDSPMETRLRLLVVLAGLPEPDVNRDIIGTHGGWLARPDLSYPTWKVAIEYDGEHHRLDRRQWRRDIARRENLEADGWIVLVITATDIYQRPGPTLMRIVNALDRRGCPDVPSRLSDEWHQI